MRLSLSLDREVFNSTISGYVEVSRLDCLQSNAPHHGRVRCSGIAILNAHMGFFSKRKVTFYEVEKDIDLSDGGRSPFSFSVPSVIEETNIALPDSYFGYGIITYYEITAYCRSCFHTSKTTKVAIVKREQNLQQKVVDTFLSKSNINDYDGLLCASSTDFVPEVHISCHLDSENLQMRDCISGTIKVDQCNMAIKDISVGIVQNESMVIHGEKRSLQLVRDTIEIATGDCPRKKDIQFVFYPNTEGLANDYASNDMQLSFSFRVKVCFENQFFCIKYIPIHFTW